MFPTRALLGRSVWKVLPNLPPIRTTKRSATILPNFVGLKFSIHNGKTYQDVLITEEMVGRKLGEFVLTRKRFSYKLSKNK
ncbi:mitochondrial 37S ribosomal protein uS19m [Aspergillus saccharolyticus JOP 1030-1]|uniref:37S ribosomal protein S19 n=1 Tax=Aspergillus saccharolyticus JOP 1030-1 TaxID=1450539 RepID=A0A318ZAP0_9EURO|nr:37S ribosomal protein S19 [Aspergillus saccharolyticus JOP 1030-1]PYH44505.1 37S ribosomal protein S19 [Aspergillus saccharolyticus JOP 1030-1]